MKLSDLRTADEIHEQDMLNPEYRREWERSQRGRLMRDSRSIPADRHCGHCGRPGAEATAPGVRLCHPNDLALPDCYRRVTVYAEPVGALLDVEPKPAGIESITRRLPPEIKAVIEEGRSRPERRTPYRRRTPRSAGSPWRILVHRRSPDPAQYRTYDVSNDPGKPAKRAETMRQLNAIRPDMPDVPDQTECTVLEGTEFDELVIGRWIHLEQMDTGKWWMNVGGVTVNVSIDRDGRPKRVDVYGPGDYAEPEEGCAYEVAWSRAR